MDGAILGNTTALLVVPIRRRETFTEVSDDGGVCGFSDDIGHIFDNRNAGVLLRANR